MSATFYLFDVDHGQCAALLTPNGQWCIFDVGCTNAFSPISWIVRKHGSSPLGQILGIPTNFQFLKGTVSHLHGDHIADYANLFQQCPEYFKTVIPDEKYLKDCFETCSDNEGPRMIGDFVTYVSSSFGPPVSLPDYGGATVFELSLDVDVARSLGGDANTRVNNASIITRIDVYGNSILLCGDMEKEAWEAILTTTWTGRLNWVRHVSNVDILVAPHHGHKSGYSTALLNLAKPSVVLASVVAKDPHVDTRYSQGPVQGMRIGGTAYSFITTRRQGHVKVEIQQPNILAGHLKGRTSWTFGNSVLT